MYWHFAIVNRRFAELFLEEGKGKKKPKIIGHCYVQKSEYHSKIEQRWIKQDTQKYRFSFRKGKYRRLI